MAENDGNGRESDNITGLTSDEIDELESLGEAWEELPSNIQERMIGVRDLRRKGFSVSAIAKVTGVSDRTVHRDIKRWQEMFKLSVERFQADERIGESIAILKEIRDRCMAAADDLMTKDDGGVENGNAARGFLHEAVTAEREINALAKDVGLMKVIPRRIEIGGRIDIRKLGEEELRTVLVDLDRQLQERAAQIARLESPSPFEEKDSGGTD